MRETLTSRVPSPAGATASTRGSVLVARRVTGTTDGTGFSGLFETADGRLWVAAAGVHDRSEATLARLGEALAAMREAADRAGTPAGVLSAAHARLGDGPPVAAFVAVLDPRAGHLSTAGAGAGPTWLARAGVARPHADTSGAPLGSASGGAYAEALATLAPGDTLVVLGLAPSPHAGHARVAAACAAHGEAPLEALVAALVADGLASGGGALALGLRHDAPVPGGGVHTLELSVPSELDAIALVTEHFNAFAEAHRVPVAARRTFDIAFDDLVSNIVSYGYGGEAGHVIDVALELRPGALVATLADDGVAFDPFAMEEPDTTLSIEEREIGGLGIHLVRRLMDEVHYERRDARNVVRLTKRLAPDDGAPLTAP